MLFLHSRLQLSVNYKASLATQQSRFSVTATGQSVVPFHSNFKSPLLSTLFESWFYGFFLTQKIQPVSIALTVCYDAQTQGNCSVDLPKVPDLTTRPSAAVEGLSKFQLQFNPYKAMDGNSADGRPRISSVACDGGRDDDVQTAKLHVACRLMLLPPSECERHKANH